MRINSLPKNVSKAGLLLLVLVIFIAFLPLPQPIGVGLDPSWRYALSHLSDKGHFFDSPIVFTYGRWGYLIRGAATESSFTSIFIFRFAVYLIFFMLCVVKFVNIFGAWERLVFALATFLPLIFADRMPIFQAESQIVMAACVMFSFKYTCVNPSRSLVFFIAGLVSGLLLHTKVSLGLYLAPSLLFLSIGSFFLDELRGRSLARKTIVMMSLFLPAVLGIFSGFLAGLVGLHGYNVGLYGQLSSGYSSAMSQSGSIDHLAIGLFFLAAIIIFLLLSAKADKSLLGACLAIIFITLFTFKHAYVRQGHFLRFLLIAPFLLALVSSFYHSNSKDRYFHCAINSITAFALVAGLGYGVQKAKLIPSYGFSILSMIDYPRSIVAAKLRAYFSPSQLKRAIDLESRRNLETLKLPDGIRNKIKGESVDVMPSEISIVAANGLNWKPRPIFQSYKSYTSELDALNASKVSSDPPQWILMNWDSIDGRHQVLDEPATFLEVFCNYGLTDITRTDRIHPILLLTHYPENMCRLGSWSGTRAINWGELVSVDTATPMIASIDIRYSFLGKLLKAAFRVPPVWLDIENVKSRKTNTYRIIPEVSGNGLLLTPLPEGPGQLVQLFEGTLPAVPVRIAVRVEKQWLYQGRPHIKLMPFSLARSSRLVQSDSKVLR